MNLATLSFLCLYVGQGQEVQGADSAVKRILAAREKGGQGMQESADRRARIESFGKKHRTMSPADAASQWLLLLSEASSTPIRMSGMAMQETSRFSDLLAVLPRPETWPAISTGLSKQYGPSMKTSARSSSLVLFGKLLLNDVAGQWYAVESLRIASKSNKSLGVEYATRTYREIYAQLAARNGDSARLINGLNAQAATLKEGNLSVPDLVALVGPSKAETLLRSLLIASKVPITIEGGGQTKKLARKAAMETIGQQKVAHWTLVDSHDAVALYEAIAKRFGTKTKPDENAYSSGIAAARANYLVGLILTNRTADAVKLAETLKPDSMEMYGVLSSLNKGSQQVALFQFLHDLLQKKPGLRLWTPYITIGTLLGKSAQMNTTIEAALKNSALSSSDRETLIESRITYLLAADKVEEALPLIRKQASAATKPDILRNHFEPSSAEKLVKLGFLLKRRDILEEGLAILKKNARQYQISDINYQLGPELSVPEILFRLGRSGEAEELLVQSMEGQAVEPMYPGMPGSGALPKLAKLYHDLGRHRDVLLLLDNAPNWGASDLAELQRRDREGYESTPIAYYAADALIKLGRVGEADPIIRWLVVNKPGFDPGYRLLIEQKGADALPLLDALYKIDQFEERPLIWKGKLLFDLKRHEEAERVIRAAIAIDPSDGEQPKGRRMLVYSVLGDILVARGQKDEAQIMHNAVRAIRLAEEADELMAGGLLTRAIRMYDDALNIFADAYCIQSRLAVQLASEGRHEEAAAHYRKAYELMPDSFGRMESHCFGCEGVFTGPQAESIAENVFAELIKKTPQKPQVHYLMGYLREQQGRDEEALPHFRQAIKLDPDYINAWQHLRLLSDKLMIPAEERERISLALARLDPRNIHSTAGGDSRDLKRIYEIADEASKNAEAVEPPKEIYFLRASAREIKKREEAAGMSYSSARVHLLNSGLFGKAASVSGGGAIGRQKIVQTLAQIIDSFSGDDAFPG